MANKFSCIRFSLLWLGLCSYLVQSHLLGAPSLSSGGSHEGLTLAHARGILQQSTEPLAKCIWNKEDKTCSVNPVVVLDYMDKAPESTYKGLISNTLACHLKENEGSCASSQMCKWDTKYSICEYAVDLSEFGTLRRCIGDASVFLESPRKNTECGTLYPKKSSCLISKECTWHEGTNLCIFDILKVLTGIPSDETLPRGLDEVLAHRAEELSEEIGGTTMSNAEDFRNYTPGPFKCPDGVDQLMCQVAQVSDEYLLLEVYCAAKQAADGICDEELCWFDDTIEEELLQCRISKELEAEATEKQREIYISAVENPTSVSILRRGFKCRNNLKEADCAGDCTWNKEMKQCNAGTQVVMEELSKHPLKDIEDPICHFVSRVFETGCVTVSMEECALKEETQSCKWDKADGICAPGPLGLMNIILEGSPALNKEFEKDFKSCQDNKDKASCS